MNLRNNTIFITGGTSGIGLALVQKFSSLGNIVITCSRNKSRLNSLKLEIPRLHVLKADLTKKRDILRLYNHLNQNFPYLNVIINCAGIQYHCDFLNQQDVLEKLTQEWKVNFQAPIAITKLLLNRLLKNENPLIINITSALGIAPKKSTPGYCASKAALRLFFQSLRYQLEATPLKIIEVVPPSVATIMNQTKKQRQMLPEEFVAQLVRELKSRKEEIWIGRAKWWAIINRLSPSWAKRMLK